MKKLLVLFPVLIMFTTLLVPTISYASDTPVNLILEDWAPGESPDDDNTGSTGNYNNGGNNNSKPHSKLPQTSESSTIMVSLVGLLLVGILFSMLRFKYKVTYFNKH